MTGLDFVLSDDPNDILLTKFCTQIIENYNGNLLQKISDLDSVYLDFNINGCKITLHQHIIMGIDLFPTNLDNPSKEEKVLVETIGKYLEKLYIEN